MRNRIRRQFDLILSAEHEENEGTDVSAEVLLNLWKTSSENTRLDASATFNKRFGQISAEDGNAKFGGKLHFRHAY